MAAEKEEERKEHGEEGATHVFAEWKVNGLAGAREGEGTRRP